MKCQNCGFESQENFNFCARCGFAAPDGGPVGFNPAAERVLAALNDPLFLAICILISVSCVLSLASSALPVILILLAVFLWLTYANGRKGIADEKHLRCVSGVVFANYVINNVVAGILLVCGVLIPILFGIAANSTETTLDEILSSFGKFSSAFAGWTLESIAIFVVIFGLTLILAAAIVLVVNLFGMRKIHRFVQSVYQGIMTHNPEFTNPRGVKNWLIFFGVCSGLNVISSLKVNFISAFSAACSTATMIIAAILINKYFMTNQY